MITSRDLLQILGISRATLNNYIAQGLVPRPEVKRQAMTPGDRPTTLGYFPDWVLTRMQDILQLKKSGMSLTTIQAKYEKENINDEKKDVQKQVDTVISESILSEKKGLSPPAADSSTVKRDAALKVTPESMDYPAYMIDFHGEVIWLNDLAKEVFFNDKIPERADGRSIFPLLYAWAKSLNVTDRLLLLRYHLHLIQTRFSQDNLSTIQPINAEQHQELLNLYTEVRNPEYDSPDSPSIQNPRRHGDHYRLVSMTFREGVFVLYVPEHGNVDDIVAWLANRDAVIRSLLAQRLPTLTPLAVMVADLQQSIRICSELPAEEYFELINQIWTTLDPIFRRYYGAYGKHTGDGMLYYFFPQPDQNYLLNSMTCAFKIKEAMKRINHEWLQKKQWNNELFMNIGLNSGEEWLGTFKTNNHLELIVLGETINTAARLSDFARYGQIWATKQLIGKLPMQDREKVTYGIQPAGERKNFIGNSFSLVENLVDGPLTGTKLADIQGVAVAEVINFKDD